MKFRRRRFRKRLSERVFDIRRSRQDCARATTFHCRPRKYAINFCLCSPRGNANTRGDFAGVIRKCRGTPRALCCLLPFSFPSPPSSVDSSTRALYPFHCRLSHIHPLAPLNFSLSLSLSSTCLLNVSLSPSLSLHLRTQLALAFRGAAVYAHVHTGRARCTRLARVSGVRVKRTHPHEHVMRMNVWMRELEWSTGHKVVAIDSRRASEWIRGPLYRFFASWQSFHRASVFWFFNMYATLSWHAWVDAIKSLALVKFSFQNSRIASNLYN